MDETKKVLITITLTSEQLASAATALRYAAEHVLGPYSLSGTEMIDTADYLVDQDNWSVALR